MLRFEFYCDFYFRLEVVVRYFTVCSTLCFINIFILAEKLQQQKHTLGERKYNVNTSAC